MNPERIIGFDREINKKDIEYLESLARQCRGDIIKMTTIAGSGHPGGSMSSLEIYLTLFFFTNISPKNLSDPKRDRIIVSHGHTAPGLYSCLARLGFFDLEDLLVGFRKVDSAYEGHIERHVPGVEWTTGNLGQGLSAGCGFSLAAKLSGLNFNTFVAMSDAEQAKGQVGEARRFARKYNLNNLTTIIDYNHTQISGRTEDVMPVNIKDNYLADGWRVIEIPGHDFYKINQAIKKALADVENPYAIIAETTIGKGVSFMENQREYHGRALTIEECQKALIELNLENDIDRLTEVRKTKKFKKYKKRESPLPRINTGIPKIYNEAIYPRAVFGSTLEEIAKINPGVPIGVFDCDLAESVKSDKFAKVRPDNFFEAGVSEHTTATIAGALSVNGIITVWADFGVFGIDEVYNQLRLNDINQTNLKILATHLGYNVGPDGKTHHCIDYIGLIRNLLGFKLIIPGDPNQTDHIVRYVLNQDGNYVVGVGRTKYPIIKSLDDKIFYDQKYKFEYGKIDLIRDGKDCAIFTLGSVLHTAISVWQKLTENGISARVYNISSPLEIDKTKIFEAAGTNLIVTYEDHVFTSGIGSIIGQIIARENIKTKFIEIGITQYGGSDNHEILYKKHGLDAESLVKTIQDKL